MKYLKYIWKKVLNMKYENEKINNQKGFQNKKSGGYLKTHQKILTLLNQNTSIMVYHETSLQNLFPHSKDRSQYSI